MKGDDLDDSVVAEGEVGACFSSTPKARTQTHSTKVRGGKEGGIDDGRHEMMVLTDRSETPKPTVSGYCLFVLHTRSGWSAAYISRGDNRLCSFLPGVAGGEKQKCKCLDTLGQTNQWVNRLECLAQHDFFYQVHAPQRLTLDSR